MSPFVCYTWPEYEGYLLAALLPEAKFIAGAPEDPVEGILASMPPQTRTFVFHLDCTVTERFPICRPPLLAELAERKVRVLNARVTDISKRAIQKLCRELELPQTAAPLEGDRREEVIVKTNSNFGGKRERELSPEQRARMGIADPSEQVETEMEYRIVERRDADPLWWDDETLVVERFVSNRDDRWYRAYLFLNQLVVCEMTSTDRIKKVGSSQLLRSWRAAISTGSVIHGDGGGAPQAVCDAVARFAHAAALDFGTIDVLQDDDGVPYVIDLNTTPYYGHPVPGILDHFRSRLV